MEKRIKIGLTAFVIVAVAIALWRGRPAPKPEFAPGIRTDRTETGRWIIYNEAELEAKPGKVSAFTVPGAARLAGLNAFVVEGDPTRTRFMSALPPGWRVQKEYIHHAFMGEAKQTCYRTTTALTEIACPVDPGSPPGEPVPDPTPQPTPGPTPIDDPRSWGVARVKAKEASKVVDTSAVKICVVDTGADMNHPNRGAIIVSQSFAGGGADDRQGHGTHTAGTVAGTGGVGVSKAKLLICKGLGDDGSGSSSSLAQCLSWCGAQGAQIVSNSWGSPQSDPLINQTIKQLTDRGVYVFVAAGNDSGDVNWPAKLSGSNPLVYAVAASDQGDRITQFSSRGPEIKFISPGAAIISNWPGGGTRSLDGTSMSCPHAAAVCAFGIAAGKKPCIRSNGTVSGYPMADALESIK